MSLCCTVFGCKRFTIPFSNRGNLNKHLQGIHKIDKGLKKYCCDKCKYFTMHPTHLKEHLCAKHNIGGYHCHLCSHAPYADRTHFIDHMFDKHGLGGKYKCTLIDDYNTDEICTEVFPRNARLKAHILKEHDPGDEYCELCLSNHGTSQGVQLSQPESTHFTFICNKCYENVRDDPVKKRVEHIWSDYVDQHLGMKGLVGNDMSLRSLGGCSRLRPDKIYYNSKHCREIDELDEHQHTGSSYTCEEQRLHRIYIDPYVVGRLLIVTRINPDIYHLEKEDEKYIEREERFELFVEFKQYIRSLYNSLGYKKFTNKFSMIPVFYLFYDSDNEGVVRKYNSFFIRSRKDFPEE